MIIMMMVVVAAAVVMVVSLRELKAYGKGKV
jgi:hypothetical protein